MNRGPICHFLSTCSFLQEAFLGYSLAAGGCRHAPTAAHIHYLQHGTSVTPCPAQGSHLDVGCENELPGCATGPDGVSTPTCRAGARCHHGPSPWAYRLHVGLEQCTRSQGREVLGPSPPWLPWRQERAPFNHL